MPVVDEVSPPSLTLHVELERYILELAASSRPVSIPKLMLVSWHVKEWVEPLLYHTLAISDYQKKPIDGYALDGASTSWGEFGGNWSCLSLLPRLTHLAFVDWAFLGTCPELLRSCKSLSALILLEAVNNGYLHPDIHDAGLEREQRFVVMQAPDYPHILRNWQIGAHNGADFWMRADDFIRKRRSGEIDALQYRLVHDPNSRPTSPVPSESSSEASWDGSIDLDDR
ncbi:hypothetical protein B0H14DRAFT_3857247 [Mycena olivaceomarginata]|nr:hypothetical protein B0H14DRAFT_3857247 [Mycena olivaceomarginata]